MRVRTIVGLVALGLVVCGYGRADIVLVEHSGYALGTDYVLSWDGYVPSIEILEPSDPLLGPYDFECYDDDTGDPADIGSITAVSNVGDIELTVFGHDDRVYGAHAVLKVQLTQAGNTSTVSEFNISGALGSPGNVTRVTYVTGYFHAGSVGNDVELSEVSEYGSIHFADFLAYTLHVAESSEGYIYVGDCPACPITGTVQIDVDANYVEAYGQLTGMIGIGRDLYGGLHVRGSSGTNGSPIVVIGRDITASGSMLFTFPLWGIVDIGRDILGTAGQTGMHFEEGLYGQVLVAGSVARGIWIEGDVLEADEEPGIGIDGDLTGRIDVGGEVGRRIKVGGDVAGASGDPAITLGGTLNRELRIYGSLYEDESAEDSDIVVNKLATTAAIVVNWDGQPWVDGAFEDVWEPGAVITVDGTDYTESDPGARVMSTSCQKGDMDGSGSTNNYDITPFVQALGDHSEGSKYDLDHVGLVGAAVFHGDCNCDGYFNNFDITPFVLRITDEEEYFDEYPECGCPNPGDSMGGGSFEAGAVAAMLKEYLDGELMPFLISVGEDIVANSPDDAEAAFWTEVLAELD
jgi:hypothetical protein